MPDPKHANDHSGATASKTRMEYATPVTLLSWSTNGTLRFIESPSFQKGLGVIVIEEQNAKLWTRIVGR